MKLETFYRDSQYLKVKQFFANKIEHFLVLQQLKNLDIDVGFVRRSGPSGHIDENR